MFAQSIFCCCCYNCSVFQFIFFIFSSSAFVLFYTLACDTCTYILVLLYMPCACMCRKTLPFLCAQCLSVCCSAKAFVPSSVPLIVRDVMLYYNLCTIVARPLCVLCARHDVPISRIFLQSLAIDSRMYDTISWCHSTYHLICGYRQ